ncbi:unnamed protein product [Bursaphelenchus okinawaensis]|uniref:PPM-type phosphatase domain-containing protein n=1 Tax=Bursaphelenchus okinawaensis TaxID=465554 RepID=A0A811JTM4_9BILA|nr:unnamed protein product [Bursaphelenchus okinawaensis]CAG9082638.1 unnamed protein product [Bursaphelenchus okinawaensis]
MYCSTLTQPVLKNAGSCRFLHRSSCTATRSRTSTDAILRANERSVILDDQAVVKVDVSQLAANRPVEDFFSAVKCLSSNAHLFGVFDGHGGASCARHVSTRLFDYICASVLEKHTLAQIPLNERIQHLFSSADPRLPSFVRDVHDFNVREFNERFRRHEDMSTVRKALQLAFTRLDSDVCNGALPDSRGRVCRMSVNVATSGSCAILTHIRRGHLHVANAGDCAAVLGVMNNGHLVARQLSKPHTIDNIDESNRVRSQHPVSERATILKGGRLLGELYPLRAFGDIRYKWPLELQKVVLEPLGMTPPNALNSPPYLTAQPEVFYHKLTPNDKFLVIASDGLWEWLDPDTIVRLVRDHTLGTQTLSHYQPSPEKTLGEIVEDIEIRKEGSIKKPLDDNSATHIIRNALGGCSGGTDQQYSRLQESLQLPPGMARNYRDDITVIVVHFSEDYLQINAESDEG